MQHIVTGLTRTGRSTVVYISELASIDAAVIRTPLWSTDLALVERPTNDPAIELMNIDCPAGQLHWRIISFPPHMQSAMHRTDTVDIQTVIEGRAELVLEEATVPMTSGDAVLIAGLAHSWRVGPAGCKISAVFVGIEP